MNSMTTSINLDKDDVHTGVSGLRQQTAGSNWHQVASIPLHELDQDTFIRTLDGVPDPQGGNEWYIEGADQDYELMAPLSGTSGQASINLPFLTFSPALERHSGIPEAQAEAKAGF